MAVTLRTLRVVPNPWHYVDHRGKPAGTCPLDPHEHANQRGWVGARIVNPTERTKPQTLTVRGKFFEGHPGSHDIEWEYSTDPVAIPNSAYYRQEIRNGSIFAADAETARAADIAKFIEPSLLIEEARKAAIVQFDAENGDGAFASFNEVQPAPAQPAPAVAAKPADKTPKGDV